MPLTAYDQRNTNMISRLSADFRRRFEPNLAWADAAAAILALPALRGFWPCSSAYYTATDRLRDVSGNGQPLSAFGDTGEPQFGYDSLAPYVALTEANQHSFQRADGGAANWADITGTESYVETAYQGITIGGWFQVTALADTWMLMAKWAWTSPLTDQRSYYLTGQANDTIAFATTSAGTVGSQVTVATTTKYSANEWFFAVGRFSNANNLQYATLNDATITAANNNTIFDGTAPFEVGIYNNRDVAGGGFWLDGLCSMMFLCAAWCSETIIQALFDLTRPLYGVRL